MCWFASRWPPSSSCSPSPRVRRHSLRNSSARGSADCSRPTSRPSASSSRTSGATSMFGVPRRVRQALQEHMVSLAERAIMDFRNDVLVTEVQWQQARTCLALATEIAPNDRRAAAKARYVDGQLARIAAQGQALGGEAGATERSQEPLHRICPPRHLVAGPVSRPGADQRVRDTRLRSAPRQHRRRRAARLQGGPAGTCASWEMGSSSRRIGR